MVVFDVGFACEIAMVGNVAEAACLKGVVVMVVDF